MQSQRIYITGFMGSGKSTIGPILANTLGWDFYDLDEEIEKLLKKSIVDIFKEDGENFFRETEKQVLHELSKQDNTIIALGGGTVANGNNLEYVKQNGKLIYLKISPGKVYQRLKYKTNRPILQDSEGNPLTKEKMIGKIQYLLKIREPFYSKADIIYNVDYMNIGRSIDQLIKIIYREF